MKYFVLHDGDKYVLNTPRPIRNSWRLKLQITTDPDLAKPFRSLKKAENWKRNNIDRMKGLLQAHTEILNNSTKGSCQFSNLTTSCRKIGEILDELTKMIVSEHDFEVDPNSAVGKLKWNRVYHKHGMEITNSSRRTCICCGLILKSIPLFKAGNSTYICIPCLYRRQEQIEAEYNKMDVSVREEIIAHEFIKNI